MQLAADFNGNDLRYRSTAGNGNTAWNRVALDNGGTYNMSISGNAATATNATTATTASNANALG
jgi:hypothetical protein